MLKDKNSSIAEGLKPPKQIPFRAILIVLFVVLVLGFVGMAVFLIKKNKNNPDNQQPVHYEVTYWGYRLQPAALDKVIGDFNASHPNITVKYEKRPVDDYIAILESRLSSGNAPDIFEVPNGMMPSFSGNLSYTETISAQQISQDFFPGAKNSCVFGDLVYCVPMEFDGLVLLYNKTKLDSVGIKEIPTEWRDMKSLAERLSVYRYVGESESGVELDEGSREDFAVSYGGTAMGTGENVTNSAQILWLMIMQNQVPLDDIEGWEDLDDDNAQVAFELYADFYRDAVWGYEFEDDMKAFENGEVPIVFVTADELRELSKKNLSFSYGTVMPPQVGEQKNFAEFNVLAVPSKSDAKDAAWEFANYMGSADVERVLYDNGAELLPARRELLKLFAKEDLFQGHAEIYMTAYPFLTPNYDVAKEATVEVLDQVAVGDTTEANALEEIISAIESGEYEPE